MFQVQPDTVEPKFGSEAYVCRNIMPQAANPYHFAVPDFFQGLALTQLSFLLSKSELSKTEQ